MHPFQAVWEIEIYKAAEHGALRLNWASFPVPACRVDDGVAGSSVSPGVSDGLLGGRVFPDPGVTVARSTQGVADGIARCVVVPGLMFGRRGVEDAQGKGRAETSAEELLSVHGEILHK